MSPDDRTVEQHRSAVIDAVVAACRSGDAAQLAFDIVGAGVLVAGEDQDTRSVLALFMLRMAKKLDPDVIDAPLMSQ